MEQMNSKSSETLYFSLCGITIKVIFHKSEFPPSEKLLKDAVKNTYGGILFKKKPRFVDFTLEFIDSIIENSYLIKKDNLNLINISVSKSDTTMESYYHISIYQFHLILKMILEKFLMKKSLLMFHGSAVFIKGKVYIFLGRSGAGKTTTISLLGSKFQKLADDNLIIAKKKNCYIFYQTPFLAKVPDIRKINKEVQVGKVYFLHKSNKCKAIKITNKQKILELLLKQYAVTRESYNEQIQLLLKFVNEHTEFYNLFFPKNQTMMEEFFEME